LNVTPFAFLLAAFALTLSRRTGAGALLVGVPVLPVRIDIDDDLTPKTFVRNVYDSLAWSLDAADIPVEQILAELGAAGSGQSRPLIQAAFGMPDQHCGGSHFDIAVQFSSSQPALAGYAEYATSLWRRGEAQSFATDYVAAIEQLAEATAADGADMTLGDVRCISAAGRRILDNLNDTRRGFPSSSLDGLFRAAASRWPSAMAIRDDGSALTYSELAGAAAEQARLLHDAGVREGDAVLIAVERSVAETVAVLGTLWAGGTYVGVDLTQPASHIARIVAKASPRAAIAGDGAASRLAEFGIPAVTPWRPGWDVDGEGLAPAPPDPDRLAYIAFTSGSTGQPKGVAIPHRGVIRLVWDATWLLLNPGDRILRMSALGFDASTLELWAGLLAGATLEVCPPGLMSPVDLGAFLEEREVTVAWITAGLFRLVQEFAPDSLSGLHHVLTGGDIVPHEHVARALRDNPGLVVSNGYGPTENTTFTTVYSVQDPDDIDGPLPIGTPVPGTSVYVLDKRGRLLPPGAVGELYTGGEGLAAGYINDQAETDRWFGFLSPDVPERVYRTGDVVRIDAAGRLCFIGRADDQVKVRGFRIELSAISDALMAQDGVEDAVVTVTDGDSTEKRLLAAVRLTPGADVTPGDLRDRVAGRLPSYMVPALWAVVDHMPVTANGKVDRRALAATAKPATAFAKQLTSRQQAYASPQT
jgi:amino acid adenylation domain-containing protein